MSAPAGSARAQVDQDVRTFVVRDQDGRLRTRPGKRLYRAESLARFVAARMFTNSRVRLEVAPLRGAGYPVVVFVGRVNAVAERGPGLQCDVLVLTTDAHITTAYSLATVQSITELPELAQ